MKHVLFITERYPPDLGGLARSSGRIASALAASGVRVDVLAWTKTLPPGVVDSSQVDGVSLHRLGLFASSDLSQQHTLNVLDWLASEDPFDVVWGHYVRQAGFLAVTFAELNAIPSIISARGNDIDQLMFPPGDFARLSWTLDRATVVTSVSRDLARKINVVLGRDRTVQVIANAVDLDTFAPSRADPSLIEALGIAPDESVLGFSGEVRHKKGLPFMLEALSHVRKHRPACLLIIGAVRPRERAQLMSFGAERPGDHARIIVTEHLDDPTGVAAHLRVCDIYWQPSVWEGLPNALLEAMACGIPAIASDAGGIPDVLIHGENGFLLPRALLNHLGEATVELLECSDDERSRIGRRARETVKAAYGPESERAALRRVLELAHRPSRPSEI